MTHATTTATPPHQGGHTPITMSTIVGRAINRNAYLELTDRFQQSHPTYRLSVVGMEDATFKTQIEDMLASRQVDISYIPSGQRLCLLAQKQRLQPMASLSLNPEFVTRFDPRFRLALSCQKQVYGIPLVHYFWGFFYKKSVFERYQLSPPNTWLEFKQLISTLSDNKVTPILLGSRNHWPAVAWMSYVNLRLHGIDYHRNLAAGNVSFEDEEFQQTLTTLAEIVRMKGFNRHHATQSWNESLPLLYRDFAGMILSGSFMLNQVPEEVYPDIGFFPFPIINGDIPQYEEVPVDGIVASQWMADQQALTAVMSFFSERSTQRWFAEQMGYLPAHKEAEITTDPLIRQGMTYIQQAEDYTQFFDRDAIPGLADTVPRIIADFLTEPDVAAAGRALEQARLNAIQNHR